MSFIPGFLRPDTTPDIPVTRAASKRPRLEPYIRPMMERDLPTCATIERGAFHPLFEGELRRLWKQTNIIGHIAESECRSPKQRYGPTLGFILWRVDDHGYTLMRLGVDRVMRDHGIGSWLLLLLHNRLDHIRPQAGALIHECDDRSIRWLARRGWHATGLARGYFEHGERDAVRMVYSAERQR